LIDFTPALRAQALQVTESFKMGPMFNPPAVSKIGGPLAALTIGTTGGGTTGSDFASTGAGAWAGPPSEGRAGVSLAAGDIGGAENGTGVENGIPDASTGDPSGGGALGLSRSLNGSLSCASAFGSGSATGSGIGAATGGD